MTSMEQIQRERRTEDEIRKMDWSEIVDKIHGLEDALKGADEKLDEIRRIVGRIP